MSQTKAQLFDVSVEGPTALKNGAFDLTLGSGGNVTISDGNLVVANGHGIDFSATNDTTVTGTSVDSELFDDYEEGTWTPVLFERVGGTGDYVELTDATYNTSFNGGWYQKVGNIVQFGGCLRLTNKGSITASDHVGIGGLPYAAAATVTPYGRQRSGVSPTWAGGISGDSGQILGMNAPTGGTVNIQLYWMNWDTGINDPVNGGDITNTTYLISFGGHYITD